MSEAFAFAAEASQLDDHPYQKALRQSLKQKQVQQKQVQQKQAQQVSQQKQGVTQEQAAQVYQSGQAQKESLKNRIAHYDRTNFSSDLSQDDQEQAKKHASNIENPDGDYFNPADLWRLIGYDIHPESRLNQLKQDYGETVKQFYSHEDLLANFAGFKCTVLSRLLDVAGLDYPARMQLKEEAKAQVVEENLHMMAENIYNTELSELLYGRKKMTRSFRKKMRLMQLKLMKQMNKIDDGYWSKERLLEEKITQCKKIKDELHNECKNLEFFVDQLWQGRAGGSVYTTTAPLTE